jgi:hypothetical protein
LKSFPEKLAGLPWVRCPPWERFIPRNGVARLQGSEIYGHVRLGTGVRLNVDVFRPEQLLGAFNGEILDHVHLAASAVVSFSQDYPSAYLLVIIDPWASSTASETKFSDAMSSRLYSWRSSFQPYGLSDFGNLRFQVSTSLSPWV